MNKTQKEKVLELIKEFQPITSRELSRVSGIDRNIINRYLNDYVFSTGKVKVAFSDKCKETGKTVGYYTLINWKQENRKVA